MSIFEPIPRDSRSDDGTPDADDDWSADVAHGAKAFDPRSIIIAGVVVAGIVVTGLVVSNMAQPEARSRPLVAARVDPGAAAVEQAEVRQPVPTVTPSASASAEPVETSDDVQLESDSDALPTWRQPEDSSDDDESDGFTWDGKRGRGHGRWNR